MKELHALKLQEEVTWMYYEWESMVMDGWLNESAILSRSCGEILWVYCLACVSGLFIFSPTTLFLSGDFCHLPLWEMLEGNGAQVPLIKQGKKRKSRVGTFEGPMVC